MVIDIDKSKILAAAGNVVELTRMGKHQLVNRDLDAGITALTEATTGGKSCEVWSAQQAKGEAKMLLEVFRGMEPHQIYEWIGARRNHYLTTGSFFSPEEAWSMGFLPGDIKEAPQRGHAPAKVLPFQRKQK